MFGSKATLFGEEAKGRVAGVFGWLAKSALSGLF